MKRYNNVIRAKDCSTLLGLSVTYSYVKLQKIREFFGKPKSQLVNVDEFSHYTGMNVESILKALGRY
jgi:predicted DNA-binding transcriptional regulator AlpA